MAHRNHLPAHAAVVLVDVLVRLLAMLMLQHGDGLGGAVGARGIYHGGGGLQKCVRIRFGGTLYLRRGDAHAGCLPQAGVGRYHCVVHIGVCDHTATKWLCPIVCV